MSAIYVARILPTRTCRAISSSGAATRFTEARQSYVKQTKLMQFDNHDRITSHKSERGMARVHGPEFELFLHLIVVLLLLQH